MKLFQYQQASDSAEASRALAESPNGVFLAGGTNLVDLMKLEVVRPDLVVDIGRLPLATIESTSAGGLRIGSTVTNSALAADPEVRRSYPLLSQVLLAGASGQLRNAATVGGNLLQRTRCHYFIDPSKPCNKREPGSGCPAREGEHHNLAVLGASSACIATHPSDMAVALMALGAEVHLARGETSRVLPLDSLYLLPGDHPEREFELARGELITAVELPPLPLARNSVYRKARGRASYAFAIGSVAAALEVQDHQVKEVRLAFGAVAPKPWRARTAEAALRGGPATRAAFRAAAELELEAAEPLRDNAYKLPLIRNLVVSALSDLAGLPE